MLAIILAHQIAVCDDSRKAGNGGPFVARVEKGDVDVGIGGEVVGLPGVGVGVEEEVDTSILLYNYQHHSFLSCIIEFEDLQRQQ